MSSSLDFSGVFQSAGVQMEQQASNAFGQAVDQFTKLPFSSSQTFDTSGGTYSYDVNHSRFTNSSGEWKPTSYASDLINYQPKHRFMFRVIFEMDPDFTSMVSQDATKFQYVIKHIDRPKVSFDYEEVNMYNFRTKVLKTIHYEPLSIELLDDIQDTFHTFFTTYVRAHSPSSRNWNSSQSIDQLERNGFGFSDSNSVGGEDSAVRGVLAGGKINPFKSIKLIQYYGHGTHQNTFVFVNPRILDISYDEVHQEGGDQGNHAMIRFDYDILRIMDPRTAAGKSEYAVQGLDMFGPNVGEANRGFGGPIFKSNPNGYGGIDSNTGGILGSMLSGFVGNAVNGVASKVLNKITNPFINTAARNLAFGVTRQVGNTAKNTLFGSDRANPGGLFNTNRGLGGYSSAKAYDTVLQPTFLSQKQAVTED